MKLRKHFLFFWATIALLLSAALPTFAATVNVTLKVQCDNGDAPGSCVTVAYSTGNNLTSATANPQNPSWSQSNGFYQCTWSPYVGTTSYGTYKCALYFEAKSGYRIVDVAFSSTGLHHDTTISGAPVQKYVVSSGNQNSKDYKNAIITVYVAKEHSDSDSREVSMNFSGDSSVGVNWNGSTVTGSSATRSNAASWTYVYFPYNATTKYIVDGSESVDFANNIVLTPSDQYNQVYWTLKDGNGNVVNEGNFQAASKEILTWNTADTDYNGYTLEYQEISVQTEPKSLTYAINVADGCPADAQLAWNAANGNGSTDITIGTGANTYTHNYTEQTKNGVILNPNDAYFNNTLTMHVEKYRLAHYTITLPGGAVVKEGSIDGGSSPAGVTETLLTWSTNPGDSNYRDYEDITVTWTTELGDGVPHFILKADPALIESIEGGTDSGTFTDNLVFSLEGEKVIVPEGATSYYYRITPKDNVEFSVTIYKNNSTVSTLYSNRTSVASGSINTSTMTNPAGVMEITASQMLPAGDTWGYTVIADENLIIMKENGYQANTPDIPHSAAGTYYELTDQLTNPYVTATEPNVSWMGYFYPAGADITDHDQAIETSVLTNNINSSGTQNNTPKVLFSHKISNSRANGGTLVIEAFRGFGSGSVTVNIDGDPSKVKITIGQDDYTGTLVRGANTVPISSNTLQFARKDDAAQQLAEASQNGIGMALFNRSENDTSDYYYGTRTACNGDVFDIKVEIDKGPFPVTVTVPTGCEGFIKEITIDGVQQNFTPSTSITMNVEGGKTFRVEGDDWGYKITSVIVDGTPLSATTKAASKMIRAAYSVEFVVEPIFRDKHFTVKTPSNGTVMVKTANGCIKNIAESQNVTIDFGDTDNPIELIGNFTGGGATQMYAHWKLNGTERCGNTNYPLNVNDNDRIELSYSTSENTNLTVSFQLMGDLTVYPDITVAGTAQDRPVSLSLAKNTVIVIRPNANMEITQVKNGSTDVTPDATGAYTLTVGDEDMVIKIYGNDIVIPEDIFTVTISGGVEKLIVQDAETEVLTLQDGRNVLQLSDLTGDTKELTFIPMFNTDYFITAITLNGTSIYQDSRYFQPYNNGVYIIPVEVGTAIEVSVGDMVRNSTLNVYVEGLELTQGLFISNKENYMSLVQKPNGDLGGELANGNNIVKYDEALDLPLTFTCPGLTLDDNIITVTYNGEEVLDFTPGQNLQFTPEGNNNTLSIVVKEAPKYFNIHVDGGYEKLVIVDGENEAIAFGDSDNQIDLNDITSAPKAVYIMPMFNTDYYITAITLNNVSIYKDENYFQPYYNGMYYIPVEEGTLIEVTVGDMPRNETLNVHVEGAALTQGLFLANKLNNATIATLEDGDTAVKYNLEIDAPLTFTCPGLLDDEYTIEVTFNGTPMDFNCGELLQLNVTGNDNLSIVVTAPQAQEFYLTYTGPEQGLIVIGNDNEFYIAAEAGRHAIDFSDFDDTENVTMIFTPTLNSELFITAITLNGTSLYKQDPYYVAYNNSTYYVPVKAGDEVEITVGEMPRDNTLHVYIQGYDQTMGCYITGASNAEFSLVEKEDGTLGGSLAEGHNIVKFDESDLPLNFAHLGLVDNNNNFNVYLNGEPVEYNDGLTLQDVAHGHELHIVVAPETDTEEIEFFKAGMRTYASHHWLMLPRGHGALVKGYIVTGYDEANDCMEIVRVWGPVPPSTGLLLIGAIDAVRELEITEEPEAKAASQQRRIAAFSEVNLNENPEILEQNLLVPAFKYSTIEGSSDTEDHYMLDNEDNLGSFNKVEDKVDSPMDQAYLVLPKSAAAPEQMHINTDVTGLTTITVDEVATGVYNLLGMKVAETLEDANLVPGIYIVNGVKYMVR